MSNIVSEAFPALEIEPKKNSEQGKTVFGYITLGVRSESMPRGFGLYNWGPSPLATNSLSLSNDEKTLTITIDARLLEYRQPDMLKYLKGKSTVTFAEGWEASDEVNKGLRARKPVVVQPGKYKVTYADDVYILTIRLAPTTVKSLLMSLMFMV